MATTEPVKSITAMRIYTPLKMDGRLDEFVWNLAPAADNFIQTEPVPGIKATHDTRVKFLYDDQAIYIGAHLYDPDPQKILKELCIRDQVSNSDLFKVFIDAYQSGLNGFIFAVNAAGVQYESIVSNHVEDLNWNAVWDSEVLIVEDGWVVEMRIPFSSLRFPNQNIQQWNVQFAREIRRWRETSYWSKIDPLVNGWVQQSGRVDSLMDLAAPVRLSLMPFVTGYLNQGFDPAKPNNFSPSFSAGADLKYGINQAFTLDMALVPDFGQVISDRQVLNLSPFEVFFEENRQFFTEGTELFNRDGLFYSRRVGGRPQGYFDANARALELKGQLLSNPETSQLYNATKLSGRTSAGTGLGFFNAVVGSTHAVIRDSSGAESSFLTSPLSNYNVFVADQNLFNNSYVRFLNTNVTRNGHFTDANVTALTGEIKTKDQRYSILGKAVMSQRYTGKENDKGYSSQLRLGKFGGKWTWNVHQLIETDRFNPNDLAFLAAANEHTYNLNGAYAEYKPKKQNIQFYNFKANVLYLRHFKPDVFADFAINLTHFLLWKSRDAYGINVRLEPIPTRDFFEPRTKDFSLYLHWPVNYTFGANFSSDYRKPLALDVFVSYRYFDAPGRNFYTLDWKPRFRFNDRISLFWNLLLKRNLLEQGYLSPIPDGRPIDPRNTYIGDRNRWIIDQSVSGRYIFNHKMGITFRIRHYWDQVQYQSIGILRPNGILEKTDLYNAEDRISLNDNNYNAFTVDLQFNYRFAPGSDLIFVWKNQILSNMPDTRQNYLRNLSETLDSPQTNSISLRVLYFIDYLELEKKLKSKNTKLI
ncbi:MAG: carbohydrate binding family 9 domain-containing protein [Saprospiraceae bacterium]|nr:carbohydrate binding family 9 domain-containing protein [Saprospiraceae bacterium]